MALQKVESQLMYVQMVSNMDNLLNQYSIKLLQDAPHAGIVFNNVLAIRHIILQNRI